MEAPKRLNYPYLITRETYKPLEGEFGSLYIIFIGRKPSDCNLLSLDASLAIQTCVLRFEASHASDQGGQTAPLGG
jgi:hypothetical protein